MTVHEFSGLTLDGFFVPLIPLRCGNCGLRVSARAAVQLEGLACR